jgi:hypothetical protein
MLPEKEICRPQVVPIGSEVANHKECWHMARLRAIKGKGGANDGLTHEQEKIRRADAAGMVATKQYSAI